MPRALFVAFLIVAHVALAADTRYTFTRLTGSDGGAGTEDGEGTLARFNSPTGVAVDKDGNVYVADINNDTVRKVAPNGYTTTLAGLAGATGKADGLGSAASFNAPGGIAVDAQGNVYVADIGNNLIRKITQGGVVTTLAGSGFPGGGDGTGSKSSFYFPAGVATDDDGNVYVADGGNHTIRKITPAGVVTTLAGFAGSRGFRDGNGKLAQFNTPQGVAIDKDRNVWVADTANDAIRKITPDGTVTTVAGHMAPGAADGPGATATFYRPCGITVGSGGNLYIADTDNNMVRVVTPSGTVSTLAGGPTFTDFGYADGSGRSARFAAPYDIRADSAGNLYVVEGSNHTVRKVTPDGTVTTLAGRAPALQTKDGALVDARFTSIKDMASDALGNVFVVDGKMIRKIGTNGTVSTVAGGPFDPLNPYVDGAAASARFQGPQGIAVDGSGNVFVADTDAHTIRRITPAGTVSTFAGARNNAGRTDGPLAQARFYFPNDVAVDRDGTMYVSDDCTIRKITTDGNVTTLTGKLVPPAIGCTDNVDGPWATAKLVQPRNLVLDGTGNLYFTTQQTFGTTSVRATANTIRKLTPGVVTTVAGDNAKRQAYRDARGNAASFYNIGGIALDAAGNIFVTEFLTHTIRKVAPDGLVSTIAGLPFWFGTTDATALDARFGSPFAILVDANGRLLIGETGRVRVAKPALSDDATVDAITSVVGGKRQLGTSPRTASNWKWSFVRQPSASAATFSSSVIADPTFTPDVADFFELRVTATDFNATSVTDVVLLAAPGTNTPSGNNVKIGTSVSVTFPSVKSSGQTLIVALSASFADPLPDLTKAALNVYEVTTTADFTAPARVCAAVSGNVSDIARYSLYHREGNAIVDRTTTRDAATKTLCADVQTLGRFILAEPAPRRRALVP
jgi:sugar lactone lactonase YvrE